MKKITKYTTLGEIIQINPEAGMILFEHGLHCIGCGFSAMESLEQGCMAHGMTKKEIDKILERLNNKKPEKKESKNLKKEVKQLPKKKANLNKIKGMIE